MKQLSVSFLPGTNKNTPLNTISDLLDNCQCSGIDVSPWSNVKSLPEVKFAIAFGENSIFVKYYVIEKELKAVYSMPNDPVYKDSCVELFIALDEKGNYYNLEFNCLGIALVEFGAGREGRTLLPSSVIKKIQSQTILKSKHGLINWELTLSIPFELFYYHILTSLKGLTCSANFHKCGDDLEEPHFLVWNNIVNDTPDFHLPEHFGKLVFENTKY